MTLAQALAQRIREHLAQHTISQREFGRRLRISQSELSYILTGKRRQDDFEFHAQVAEQLGVPLSALIAELEGRVAAGRPVLQQEVFVVSGTLDVRAVEQAAQTLRKIADALWAHQRGHNPFAT